MSVEFAVQKAIDALLLPVLADLTPTVALVDHAEQGQAYPYVQFSRVIGTPDNLLAANMTRVQVALTIWSNFRGQEQILEIAGAIKAVLDDAVLDLDEGTAVRCDHERTDSVRDQDGVTYIGTALYTVLVRH